MPVETLSFRYMLVETMQRFLAGQAPDYTAHADFFTELIVSLAGHREEGADLYPVVFVIDAIESVTEALGGKDPVWIGEGQVNRELVHQTLKHCAPLAERRQWAIFIQLGDQARYGVFRTESSPLSPTTFGSLRAMARDDLFMIGLLQIGVNVIEVRAANGDGLHLYLSGARIGARQPVQVIKAFIDAVSQDTPAELRQPLRDLYYRVFTELTRDVHGALIAVLPVEGARLDIFTDAVLLEAPISIPDAIRELIETPGVEANSRLYSRASLIRGMLSCDGITLFRSDGVVLGYNAFIQPATQTRAVGGARLRAYDALASYVGQGVNLAVYRSQDGNMDFTGLTP